MPPSLAPRALLVVLVHDAPIPPPSPLHSVAARGVSTTVVHPHRGAFISDPVAALRAAVHGVGGIDERGRAIENGRGEERFEIVDAMSLGDAERVVEEAMGAVEKGKLMVGVIIIGCWERMEKNEDGWRPRQSWEVGQGDGHCWHGDGEDAGDVGKVGEVAWFGRGMTRVDALQGFGEGRGGEGSLLPSQIVAEVLAKVGLRGKFGD